MLRIILLALGALAIATPLVAQDDEATIEQAFPRDTLLYVELDLQNDFKALFDAIPLLEEKGAVGLGYASIAAALESAGILADAANVKTILEGFKKATFGIVNGTTDGIDYLTVFEHNEAMEVIRLLEKNTNEGALIFESNEVAGQAKTWTMQVPDSYFNPFGGPMRAFWRGANVEEYSDPITVSVFENKYLIFGNRESHVQDAILQLEYPDDDEYSLPGSSAFRKARKGKKAGEDAFVFWNITGTIRIIDRVTAGANQGYAKEIKRIFYDVLEVKQFSYLAAYLDYDSDARKMTNRMEVRYYNKPSWFSVLPDKVEPKFPLEYVPANAASVLGLSIGSAKDLYEKFDELIKRKAEAIGDPQLSKSFKEAFSQSGKLLGLESEEVINLIGSDHILISIPKFDGEGLALPDMQSVAVFSVTDEQKLRDVVEKTLRTVEDEDVRERFFKTAEQRTIKFKDGSSKSINAYYSANDDSAAWMIEDGKFFYGAVSALEAVLKAKHEGNNLPSSKAFQAHIKENPIKGVFWGYTCIEHQLASVYARNSEHYMEQARNQSMVKMLLNHEELLRKRLIEPAPTLSVGRKLAEKIKDMITTDGFEITEDALIYTTTVSGMPNVDAVTDMIVTGARASASEAVGTRLKTKVFPEVSRFLFREGRLPKDAADLIGEESEKSDIFRDPSLAGNGVKEPSEDQSLVWLGSWENRDLTPAVPLAHTRKATIFGIHWVLFSDGSCHRVSKESLDGILEHAQASPEERSPYSSRQAQTIKGLVPDLHSAFKLGN